jgi:hypothetical protein
MRSWYFLFEEKLNQSRHTHLVVVASIHPVAERNCWENRNELHFRVPEVGNTRGEAPLLPLCGTTNADPVSASYLPNSF